MTARSLGLLLMAFGAAPAAADDATLGRLFFTPAERNALEEARRKNIRAEAQAVEAASKPKPPPVRSVAVTGVVRRSDGETTVWVNGKPVDGATEDGLKVRVTAGGQAAVIVHQPERGRTVRLKVGQRADIDSGRIQESYESRAAHAAAQEQSEPALPTEVRAEPPAKQQARTSGADKRDSADTAEPSDAEAQQPAN
jgi:hypothetical protein